MLNQKKAPLHSNLQAIAKFGSVYGLNGWLRVYPFTVELDDFVKFKRWFDCNGGCLSFNNLQKNKKGFLVSLVGVSNPEAARTFVNQVIYAPVEDFPILAQGEYYWFDLIGCVVINTHQTELGKVVSILPTGSNDVLVVESNSQKKRILIPFLTTLDKVIIKVDLALKLIIADWDIDY